MSTYSQLKTELLEARKNKSPFAITLSTLIGESETIATRSGSKTPSDEVVLATIRKTINNNIETINVISSDSDKHSSLVTENSFLSNFLPKQFDAVELQKIVDPLIASGYNLGQVMKHFKEMYNGQYDGKMLSSIVNTSLSK